MNEIELIEQAAIRVGMKSLMNHGAASCVYTEGCNGVSQEHLIAFAREVALHCVSALSGGAEAQQAAPQAEAKPVGQECPDGLLPDGEICPRCGGKRGPSGVDGGTWVHYRTTPLPAQVQHEAVDCGTCKGDCNLCDTHDCGDAHAQVQPAEQVGAPVGYVNRKQWPPKDRAFAASVGRVFADDVPLYDRPAQQQPVSAEARLKRANLLIASIPYTEYLFSAQNAYVEKERAERYARTLLIAALAPPQAEPGKGEA